MKEIKTCIFDLDGVLCDTAKYHFLAWKTLAEKLGIVFTEKDNERLKGVSRMESLDILLSLSDTSYTNEQKQAFAEEKNAMYVDLIMKMNESDILPGVIDMLQYCRENKMNIALGSVSKNAPLILERLHLNDYFDAIIDGTNVTRAKPDPEVFLKGAMQTNTMPDQCVVFEDARAGIEAAKAGNMIAVGIGDASILTDADFVIAGFTDMTPDQLLSKVEQC